MNYKYLEVGAAEEKNFSAVVLDEVTFKKYEDVLVASIENDFGKVQVSTVDARQLDDVLSHAVLLNQLNNEPLLNAVALNKELEDSLEGSLELFEWFFNFSEGGFQ